MTSGTKAPPLSRAQRVKRTVIYAIKRTLTLLLSHVGLTSVVVGYVILGGLIFMALEAQEEIRQRVKAETIRNQSVLAIRDLITRLVTSEPDPGGMPGYPLSNSTTNTASSRTALGDLMNTNNDSTSDELEKDIVNVTSPGHWQVDSVDTQELELKIDRFLKRQPVESGRHVTRNSRVRTDQKFGADSEIAPTVSIETEWVRRPEDELLTREGPLVLHENMRAIKRTQISIQSTQTDSLYKNQVHVANKSAESAQTFAGSYKELKHQGLTKKQPISAKTTERVGKAKRELDHTRQTQHQQAAVLQQQQQQQREPQAERGEMEKELKDQMIAEVRELVKELELRTHELTAKYNWDGSYSDEEDLQWSFPGAMLYAVTVVTTIGYGHLAPKTNLGRVVTIGYAIVGIPLTFLCVRNIGSILSVIVTGIYRHAFVGLVMRWRLAKARMRRSRRINLIKEVMNDGARRLSTQLSRHWLTIDRHLVRDEELRKSLRRLRKERKRWRFGRVGARTGQSEDTEPFEEEDEEEMEEKDDKVMEEEGVEERREAENREETEQEDEEKNTLSDTEDRSPVSGSKTARVHWKKTPQTKKQPDVNQKHQIDVEGRDEKKKSQVPQEKDQKKLFSRPRPAADNADSSVSGTTSCKSDPLHTDRNTSIQKQTPECNEGAPAAVRFIEETEIQGRGEGHSSRQNAETTAKQRSVKKVRVERTASSRSCDAAPGVRETNEDKPRASRRNTPSKRSMQRKKEKREEHARSVFLEEQEKFRRLLLEATRSASSAKTPAPRGRSRSFDATASKNDSDDIAKVVKRESTTIRLDELKVGENRPRFAVRPTSLHIMSQPATPAARRLERHGAMTEQTTPSNLPLAAAKPFARSSTRRGHATSSPESQTLSLRGASSEGRCVGDVACSEPMSNSEFPAQSDASQRETAAACDGVTSCEEEEDDEEDPLSKPPDTSKVRVPAWVTLLIMTAYILGGAVMFTMWENDWDFLEGCYFCFITLSTIGFGDFVPGTSLDSWAAQEKWTMCCVYLLFGMAMQSMCFHLMQEEVRASVRGLAARCGLASKNKAVVEEELVDHTARPVTRMKKSVK